MAALESSLRRSRRLQDRLTPASTTATPAQTPTLPEKPADQPTKSLLKRTSSTSICTVLNSVVALRPKRHTERLPEALYGKQLLPSEAAVPKRRGRPPKAQTTEPKKRGRPAKEKAETATREKTASKPRRPLRPGLYKKRAAGYPRSPPSPSEGPTEELNALLGAEAERLFEDEPFDTAAAVDASSQLATLPETPSPPPTQLAAPSTPPQAVCVPQASDSDDDKPLAVLPRWQRHTNASPQTV